MSPHGSLVPPHRSLLSPPGLLVSPHRPLISPTNPLVLVGLHPVSTAPPVDGKRGIPRTSPCSGARQDGVAGSPRCWQGWCSQGVCAGEGLAAIRAPQKRPRGAPGCAQLPAQHTGQSTGSTGKSWPAPAAGSDFIQAHSPGRADTAASEREFPGSGSTAGESAWNYRGRLPVFPALGASTEP